MPVGGLVSLSLCRSLERGRAKESKRKAPRSTTAMKMTDVNANPLARSSSLELLRRNRERQRRSDCTEMAASDSSTSTRYSNGDVDGCFCKKSKRTWRCIRVRLPPAPQREKVFEDSQPHQRTQAGKGDFLSRSALLDPVPLVRPSARMNRRRLGQQRHTRNRSNNEETNIFSRSHASKKND